MPKRSSNQPKPNNNATASLGHAGATKGKQREQKNPAAVALGRLGGLKGGKARAAKLSGKVRSAIARKAARARWG